MTTELGIKLPRKAEILMILRDHPLFKYKGIVKNVYLVGSFCRGNFHAESDLDILIQVPNRGLYTDAEYTELQRKPIRDYFIRNNIKGKADHIHPQWEGRRIDVYFTFEERLTDCIKLP